MEAPVTPADGDGEGPGIATWLDPTFATNPQPFYKRFREQAVLRMESGLAMLTRRPDIDWALRHPEVFSSEMGAALLGNVRPLIPLQIDPPEHVKFRRLLDPLFAPRLMALLEEDTAALVNDLIDGIVERGSCDFSTEFAIPLPSQVFLKMFGLPMADLDQFLAMKDGIIRPAGDSFEEHLEVRQRTAQDIYAYFDAVLDEREREPKDDLLSKFIVAEVDGERLTREDVLDICFLLLIAGLDTVTDSLTCFFAYLAQHPDHRREICDDPSVIPSAVEELLRWESPVPAVARIAKQDTEVGGCPIKAGELVTVSVGSANTDESEFADGDRVDLRREPNRHVAFGGGVHRCLGSHLARLELRVALREWHRRIPDYELAPGTELEYTVGLRSLEHLPLVFDPPSGR